jgi:hypothetical protein
MAEHFFLMQVQCGELLADVRCNGCSVFLNWDARGRSAQLQLGPWLVKGENTIEVFLGTPAGGQPTEYAAFRLAIHKLATGGQVWDGSALFGYRWTANEGSLRPGALTRVLSHRCSSSESERWSWQDTVPLGADDRPAIVDRVRDVHHALAGGDFRTVGALLRVRLEETMRTTGRTREEVESELQEALAPAFSGTNARLEPIDPASLLLEPGLGGQLVHVRAPSGAPPIVGVGDGTAFALGLSFGRLGGGCAVVR